MIMGGLVVNYVGEKGVVGRFDDVFIKSKSLMDILNCPQNVRHNLGAFFMERKVKYSSEFKLDCIKKVLKHKQSVYWVAKENNLKCDFFF